MKPNIPKQQVRLKRLPHFKGELPQYETPWSSGFDVRAQLTSDSIVLSPGARALIPTGLAFEIPNGYEIQLRPRSGIAIKQGIGLLNSPGTIDGDYRGEVKVILINLGQHDFVINDQDRIAQMILCPVVQAEWRVVEQLSETQRGIGGFGSTGV